MRWADWEGVYLMGSCCERRRRRTEIRVKLRIFSEITPAAPKFHRVSRLISLTTAPYRNISSKEEQRPPWTSSSAAINQWAPLTSRELCWSIAAVDMDQNSRLSGNNHHLLSDYGDQENTCLLFVGPGREMGKIKRKGKKKKLTLYRKCNIEDTKQQSSTGDTHLGASVFLWRVEFSRKLAYNGTWDYLCTTGWGTEMKCFVCYSLGKLLPGKASTSLQNPRGAFSGQLRGRSGRCQFKGLINSYFAVCLITYIF